MGNNSPCKCDLIQRHAEELMELLDKEFSWQTKLSFDIFGDECCEKHAKEIVQPENEGLDSEIPKIAVEGQETTNAHTPFGPESLFGERGENGVQQKNQIPRTRVLKNKTITKGKKQNRCRKIPVIREAVSMNPEEAEENSTDSSRDDSMRNQNNCKSYHKLVKNYLIQRGLGHLFDQYEVSYHPRYYFVVALIFIKYYLRQDFMEAYRRIVEKEIAAQQKKIARKEAENRKVMSQLDRTAETSSEYKKLLKRRDQVQEKISHIKVVIHEIEDFSVRSCEAFFSGNTQKSLRILYQKDDPVMRKKTYFASALAKVALIQNEVRKATSQTL